MRVECKFLKALSRVASRELGRYNIDGVHVTKDGMEATDGRALLVAPVELDKGEEFKARVVAPQGIKAMLASPTVKLRGGSVVNLTSNGTIHYTTPAGECPVEWRDVEFPDTRGVMSSEERKEAAFSVTFSADLLKRLCEAAMDVRKDDAQITLTFSAGADGKPSNASAVRVDLGDGVRGVAMPMAV